MAIPTFPLPYTFSIEKTITYATRTVVFESQVEQVQRMAISPVKQWKITCKGSNTDRLTLETFFDTVGGNSLPFYFTDENGSTQTVRFADKTLSISTIYREFDLTSLTHGTPVGFTAEISVKTAL